MTSTDEELGLLNHYKRLLAGSGIAVEGTRGGLERMSRPTAAQVGAKLAITKSELHRIVKDYLDDDPALYEIADKIAEGGRSGLMALGQDNAAALAEPEILAGLESIVRTDGTRPSFMIRNGVPDLATSPIGTWRAVFDDESDKLQLAISSVGRIDDPAAEQGFQGTGCLIGENLVMTNRHVLQAIASPDASGVWTLKPGISIDFRHEYRLPNLVKRREITGVVFAGSKPIDFFHIDHDKLDLALLELAPPATNADRPEHVLAVDATIDWGTPRQQVFVIGYPGAPSPGLAAPSLLEQLFKSTYGHKRIAPGMVTSAAGSLPDNERSWTLAHDATTLAGSSGSCTIVMGRKSAAAGLHYGGSWRDPRENWSHVLGRTLDETDGQPRSKRLRTILEEHGVRLLTEGANV